MGTETSTLTCAEVNANGAMELSLAWFRENQLLGRGVCGASTIAQDTVSPQSWAQHRWCRITESSDGRDDTDN